MVCTLSGGPTLPFLQVSLQSDHSKCTIWNASGFGALWFILCLVLYNLWSISNSVPIKVPIVKWEQKKAMGSTDGSNLKQRHPIIPVISISILSPRRGPGLLCTRWLDWMSPGYGKTGCTSQCGPFCPFFHIRATSNPNTQ